MIGTAPRLSILGGGPAGLASGYYAQQHRIPFVLFEGASEVGGLCRTLETAGHAYDTGAHRFHDRYPEITEDLRLLLGDRLRPVRSPSKVYVAGRFLDFPPTPISTLRSSGVTGLGFALADLAVSRLRKQTPVSFADFAVNGFGETLARQFLLNYSEKVWGLPASQLSPDIATRRLSGMTMLTLFMELLFPWRKTAHIDGHFLYPRGGYGKICRALAASLPGETICRAHLVTALECQKERIEAIRFRGGSCHVVSGEVLSSLPLTLTVRLLGPHLPARVQEACSRLRFRNIRLLFIRLARERISRNATIYLPDRSFCISRVHEPRNRCSTMAPDGETSLVAEVPCFEGEAIARLAPEALFERVLAELEEAGLILRSQVLEWRHHLLPNAYPVYSLDYSHQVALIQSALRKVRNLHMIGRNGRFFYSHLHHQMRFAKELISSLAVSRASEAKETPPA